MSSSAHTPQASVVRLTRPSTVDLVATELRNAIFTGSLPVGAPIVEGEMAHQLGVSRGPLREAAQRLVEQGVFTSEPGRGLHVTVVDADQAADVYRTRFAVEAQAVRSLAHRPTTAIIESLESHVRDLDQAKRGGEARIVGDHELAFHQLLVDLANSPRLSSFMATLVIETRLASFSHPDGYKVMGGGCDTYYRLIEALACADQERAVKKLHSLLTQAFRHVTTSTNDLVTLVPTPDDAPPPIGPISRE